MQHEIITQTPLLDDKGRLTDPGWARRMHYVYAREKARGLLKEWDFYQMLEGDMLLQLTIGHVSYMASFSATLLNLSTGKRRTFGRMRPLPGRRLNMPQNPETPHELAVSGRDFTMRFTVKDDVRLLQLDAPDVEIDVQFDSEPDNDKMVIATPLGKPHQFYCNYKENYYHARGRAAIGDMSHRFTDATGLLDWGRGVWPYRHEWYWGSASAIVGGRRFGFNIGWGFGDLSKATENMFFIDGRATKLGELRVENEEAEDRMRPWRITDPEGRFDLTMRPRFDNFTETNIAVVHTYCHQIFARFDGFVVAEDGERIEINNLTAFVEHAVNRW